MTKPAVEFEVFADEFRLVYRPRDDTSWVRERFERGDELLVKGTFHLTSRDLVEDAADEAANAAGDDDDIMCVDDDRLVFAIATAEGEYFLFKPEILGFDTPVLLHRDIVDIITYDDLLARLQAVLDQLRSGPALSAAPATLQAK
jgi:hypothetical protein